MNSEVVNQLLGDQVADISKMINSTPSCLKIISQDGLLLNMNSTGLDLIEADSMDSVLGANVYDLVEESHRDNFIAFNKKICAGIKGTLVFEIVGLQGTRRWMETYAAPFRLTNGEIAHIAITNDITAKIEAEEELSRKEQALIQSARLSALGEFVSGIAHEINNPMAIISGKTDILLLKLHTQPDSLDHDYFKHNLELISETVKRISQIIVNLKTYSRSPAEHTHRWYNLRHIVNGTVNMCNERFKGQGIQIDADIDTDVGVYCENVQLSQVLMNLLNNSYDVLAGTKDPWIRIETRALEKVNQLLFTDSGLGIKEELIEKIMTPFFTTKEVGKGTGLGLSISANIVKSFGGRLFYNRNNKHTQFIIEYPKKNQQYAG